MITKFDIILDRRCELDVLCHAGGNDQLCPWMVRLLGVRPFSFTFCLSVCLLLHVVTLRAVYEDVNILLYYWLIQSVCPIFGRNVLTLLWQDLVVILYPSWSMGKA